MAKKVGGSYTTRKSMVTPEEAMNSVQPFFDDYRARYGHLMRKPNNANDMSRLMQAIAGGLALNKGMEGLTGYGMKDIYKWIAGQLKSDPKATGSNSSVPNVADMNYSEENYTFADNAFDPIYMESGNDTPSYEGDFGIASDPTDYQISGSDNTIPSDLQLEDNAFDSDYSGGDSGGGYSLF